MLRSIHPCDSNKKSFNYYVNCLLEMNRLVGKMMNLSQLKSLWWQSNECIASTDALFVIFVSVYVFISKLFHSFECILHISVLFEINRTLNMITTHITRRNKLQFSCFICQFKFYIYSSHTHDYIIRQSVVHIQQTSIINEMHLFSFTISIPILLLRNCH